MISKSLFSFVALFLAICAYLFFDSYKEHRNFSNICSSFPVINYIVSWLTAKDENVTSDVKLFTVEELSLFNGIDKNNIYLSILGKVFDVTKGKNYYAKGESYHGFAGRDASKAFVTGDFSSSGLTDDISTLKMSDIGDLHDWLQMYEKDYIYKGRLIGRFYASNGEPTAFLEDIHKKLAEFKKEKSEKDEYKNRYPPCNVEWSKESGTKVWCSNKSGGISRDWIGVPRKFYQPGSSTFRCACLNPSERITTGKFIVYENCTPDSVSCFIKTNE